MTLLSMSSLISKVPGSLVTLSGTQDGRGADGTQSGEGRGVGDNKAFTHDKGEVNANDKSGYDQESMKSVSYSSPAVTAVENPGIRDLVVKYASKSTVHGLPSTVAQSLYNGQRHLWFFLVFSMAVALTVAITVQLKNYYEYPTVVNIREVAMTTHDIPEVTICDQEPMTFMFIENPWKKAAEKISDLSVNINTETLTLSNESKCKKMKVQTGDCLFDKANNTERTRLLAASLDRSGWRTPQSRYYPRVVTSIGICNTFRTSALLKDMKGSPNSLHSAQVPLDIVMAVKPSVKATFMNGIRSGIQVTLHTKDEPAFPRKRKVFVPLNSSCRIKYKKITRKSLTTPYKSFIGEQCIDTDKGNFKNPLTRYSVYSKDTCLEECFVNFTIAQCGCRYYLHPGHEPLCGQDVVLSCMEKTRVAFSSYKKNCQCQPPCEETEFESYLSCSKILRPEHTMIHIELMSSAEVREEITQVPVYSLDSIMGSLGGLIGLFMGFSLVSLMEFIELIIITASRCCAWRRGRRLARK